ncbi:TetM/TetW/TetO/TetS family tetracycline resistance ribosomal protection protein [Limosilactobacillus fermentum]|uniref:elongation factor G n=1 Tax=Limosilactobacillus fermentum TaxID=1613 RepID=UPI001FCBB312|nr:TetM/TetW/TetO/TetS family tetracycline resistance ribosomal protection protein [Limosilactobacillus fermentum]MCJ2388464.1 TetM/TetW/TetO/TetS family tetracycline resistance ribosomal protection protein [Limosilactobacillus fermentum]
MSQIVTGLVAHVDAGKTTLSEALLYHAGVTRQLGRVDKGSTFLDPDQLEQQRGITIFSHQAELSFGDLKLTLLDTPGHIDFLAATERVLAVLDYAILVVSAPAGVQATTRILWDLLDKYQVPTFVSVNKMDAPGVDQAAVLAQLQAELDPGCLPFKDPAAQFEELALLDEGVMDDYLTTGEITPAQLRGLIKNRCAFPVYFGAALKDEGVADLIKGLTEWTQTPTPTPDFGARVFKVSHDERGNRLTWLRVTGGNLRAKAELLPGQKADQLRVYNGAKATVVQEVGPGQVCTVAGPTSTVPGQGIGAVEEQAQPRFRPALTYGLDQRGAPFDQCLAALRQLEDEEPLLGVVDDPATQRLYVQVMGEVQLEILTQRLEEEFGLTVGFDEGRIRYQETLTTPIEGVGHFEPLRHYAEVHLLLEPGSRGSGLTFAGQCHIDVLSNAWQGQILTALKQRAHRGILIGAPLTDVKVTLVGGKGSIVHTVGGDFRQAAWRALRQGLMEAGRAGNQLLEPWYNFQLLVPTEAVGHALTDLQRFGGEVSQPQAGPGDLVRLEGSGPVAKLRDYAATVRVYTHGQGQLTLTPAGSRPVADPTPLIEAANYDPVGDLANTPDSVFCAHGAGYPVAWDQVPQTMHVPYQTTAQPR